MVDNSGLMDNIPAVVQDAHTYLDSALQSVASYPAQLRVHDINTVTSVEPQLVTQWLLNVGPVTLVVLPRPKLMKFTVAEITECCMIRVAQEGECLGCSRKIRSEINREEYGATIVEHIEENDAWLKALGHAYSSDPLAGEILGAELYLMVELLLGKLFHLKMESA